MERARSPASNLLPFLLFIIGRVSCSLEATLGGTSPPPATDGLCAALIRPSGYPCSEHTGGDTWFANSFEQSLGFILADNGFDVWVGNVRGTRWSHGHTRLSVHEKAFWDWSWQELAQYDLQAMISYVYSVTNSKIFYVGHSQACFIPLTIYFFH
ncbi:hypothetical protein ZIOFF_022793 [Zingiber officinale]|uniref:Uncharacterized protein n=1 Tax=Zingiber officinale TaxID=94328 RepID=A0A8J5HA63_ZINOF|nr:hypothetical protein ZIOFF_022793 [Zingiber officinale]